jgi:hypothetical protein
MEFLNLNYLYYVKIMHIMLMYILYICTKLYGKKYVSHNVHHLKIILPNYVLIMYIIYVLCKDYERYIKIT